MKKIINASLLLLFTFCFTGCNNSETEQLNHRVTQLEQKIDSLLGSRNNYDSFSYGSNQHAGRCQAVTKKGTQCKRAARNNNYCWQHGG